MKTGYVNGLCTYCHKPKFCTWISTETYKICAECLRKVAEIVEEEEINTKIKKQDMRDTNGFDLNFNTKDKV